ncbi:uncharacterized protein LOC135975479 [Chrysemys picta bellii]|uniref:uncharacterized protein LOC135975479 n=1 Tax=Chrysemys picta bellii TaxID=8478 RepID=UPI0032B145AD
MGDHPPAPKLSWDPEYTVYLPGERVTLTCSAPGDELASGYRFFSQEGQQEPSAVQPPNEGARLELTAAKGNVGTYTCAYWRWESNREISSRNSSSVSIPVTDIPAAPTLSLSPPHQLYLTGESVRLTCSPPRGDEAVTRFQFYKYRGNNISPDVLPNSWATNFKLKPEHSGWYTCLYWIRPSGREIPSVQSASVSISVREWRAQVTTDSSSAQATMQADNRKRAPAWTVREVLDLIAVWGEDSVLAELRSKRRNAKTFEKISKGMMERGHNRDSEQCRVKVKELRQAYQKTKEANGRSGSEPRTCRFYAELHAILGGAANTTPPVIVDSGSGIVSSATPEDSANGGEEEEEDEDDLAESTQHSILPNSQDLFLTLTEVPSQASQASTQDSDPMEGTSGEFTF